MKLIQPPPKETAANPQIGGRLAGVASLALLLSLAACEVSNRTHPPPDLSSAYFDCAVQPILSRECSFPACHGNDYRGFRLFAVGRMRLSPALVDPMAVGNASLLFEIGAEPELSQAERASNRHQSSLFARPNYDPGLSPLLARPLALGVDAPCDDGSDGCWATYHGSQGDVFRSPADPRYLALSRWLHGGQEVDCP